MGRFFLFRYLFCFFGVVGHFFVCFWQNNSIAQITYFGRFGGPEKGL